MTAIEILRAASRSVPNEDYVQFMAAVDAVAELIEADKEYDAAWAVEWGEGGAAPKHISDRRIAAAKRRAAALANVGGA